MQTYIHFTQPTPEATARAIIEISAQNRKERADARYRLSEKHAGRLFDMRAEQANQGRCHRSTM